MSEEKTFPKERSQWTETITAYSVEISPITRDVPSPSGYGTCMRGEWYPCPVTEAPAGFGIPNVATSKPIGDRSLYTKAGVQALKWALLAHAENERPRMEWDVRFIKHEINSTYKDVEIEIADLSD